MDSTAVPNEFTVNWTEPWIFAGDDSDWAAQELQLECPAGHVLRDVPVTLIARRCDCDDVLFRLMDESGRYAVVHLSFAEETDPRWPITELYPSLANFVAERLQPDIENYG